MKAGHGCRPSRCPFEMSLLLPPASPAVFPDAFSTSSGDAPADAAAAAVSLFDVVVADGDCVEFKALDPVPGGASDGALRVCCVRKSERTGKTGENEMCEEE